MRLVGSDLAAGMRPQHTMPGGAFHVPRLRESGAYALLGTRKWSGVIPADVEAGDPAALMAAYPAMRGAIAAFTHHAPAGTGSG